MTHGPLVVLTPIAPASTGNGLAMRAHRLAQAAGRDHDVHLVVVPVAGRQPAPDSLLGPGTTRVEIPPAGERTPGALLSHWMADGPWRQRTRRLLPLPAAVGSAPPAWWEKVAATLADEVVAVLAFRLTLGPLGLALAEGLGVPLIIDADDDDAGWLPGEEGAAWARVGHLCLPAAALVTASSGPVAEAVTERYQLARPARVVPNAVEVPHRQPAPAPSRPPRRLLMVANLTYGPNIDGAVWLATEVMPLLGPGWHLDLVGSPAPSVSAVAGPTTSVHGWVPDPDPYYRQATVVIAAVSGGSGTRTKVLEAMAAGRPLVATTAAIVGLPVTPGSTCLVADEPHAFADAVRQAADPAVAGAFTATAWAWVRDHYAATSVVDAAADLLSSAIRSRE